MRKLGLRLIALCVAVCMLFSGCGVIDLGGYFDRLSSMLGMGNTSFESMDYVRPDVDAIEEVRESCAELAADENADLDELSGLIYEYFFLYSGFGTNYYLAYIHYSIDMSDTYWETEYNYCAQQAATVDGGRDRLMYALADSPHRDELESDELFGEGYFASYDGESAWDEAFTALMEQEAALQNEYYRLSGEALEAEFYSEAYFEKYGTQLAELYVQMIKLRQQIALEAGYSDYPSFAYDFYHHRDYSVAEATQYITQIQQELVPLYRTLNTSGFWNQEFSYSSENQTYQYVQQMAKAVGGTVEEAFDLMDDAGLYHIAYGENKYAGSFEVFLPDYMEPFVFVSPTGTLQDQLTFAHEFGHFCNDYASYDSMAGIDVAEIFSQGMEYLSLCYVENSGELEKLKMADSLCVYVEQAAYASFEHQVYGLTGEHLTAENVQALFAQVGKDFGMDSLELWDSRGYVAVNHFFTSPLYVISYVVSNDAAMQLYQMEKEESGTGLASYTDNLATEESDFLAFLEEAKLESPFADGRVEEVKKTFEAVLG